MQVSLSVKGSGYDEDDSSWASFANACRWFNVVALVLSVALMTMLFALVCCLVTREVVSTLLHLAFHRRHDDLRNCCLRQYAIIVGDTLTWSVFRVAQQV